MVRHFVVELLLPLSIFFAVMVTLFVDWSWIPLSSIDLQRGNSLEQIKRDLVE